MRTIRKNAVIRGRQFGWRGLMAASLICTGLSSVIAVPAGAQSPAATPAPARSSGRGPAPAARPDANLGQLMKGILFPNSNVIFAAQNTNPAEVPPGKDPSTATDPLANTYGKWEAVENSGLALAESANLLTIPGRKCANGRPVPMGNADWPKLVQGLRDAGLKAYKAAQSKDQDKILDAADTMTTACSNCHEKYREKATPADRCK
jgi:hypothetical protein